MRVAVLYFKNGSEKVRKISSHLARGIEAQGHQVTLIDGETDSDVKLTIYEYILVGTTPVSFFSSKISGKISTFLNNAGRVSGTKSYAFIVKNGIFVTKSLHLLMKNMEKEGMFLKISDVITSAEEAEIIGKKLHIN
ncbi:hypothetical protein EXM22_06730 [Oceanispirochaeta crateris]|uniref:Flavodoxin-like domain-containing protein n=1 Tax=Oceanispirochaeta crateris TaxID=2518645 RepID=A0A5C1QK45_9SPIO|nr:hypothetical protein [Oceanispirochaeta crateris]QEN07698.1 hypothetical protein EXM22_06730 [Oceanispirochaeta crateris]